HATTPRSLALVLTPEGGDRRKGMKQNAKKDEAESALRTSERQRRPHAAPGRRSAVTRISLRRGGRPVPARSPPRGASPSAGGGIHWGRAHSNAARARR